MQGAVIRRAIVVVYDGARPACWPFSRPRRRPGRSKGRVIDAKGQPVEGAVVTIEATDGMGRHSS